MYWQVLKSSLYWNVTTLYTNSCFKSHCYSKNLIAFSLNAYLYCNCETGRGFSACGGFYPSDGPVLFHYRSASLLASAGGHALRTPHYERAPAWTREIAPVTLVHQTVDDIVRVLATSSFTHPLKHLEARWFFSFFFLEGRCNFGNLGY